MEEGKQKVNILLVDDNPSNLLALETILQAPDRNLVRASSGEDALRFLLDDDAAVILLDVHMPSISGLETAALIRGRERTRGVPIIFLTAYDSAGDSHISQGYSLGAVDYIIKPIDPEALKSKVAVFVELYRKTEQIKRQADLLREQNIELENANLQRLARLIDLGQRLAAERDPERVLESFCGAAREIMGARFATVGILEDDGVTLRHFFTSGFDRATAVKAHVPQACQLILKQRFAGARSLRLSGTNGLRILPEQTPVKSFVGAPILQQGYTEFRGWLYLAEKIGAPAFSEADERFTVTLTQAVVFYENARLYADLQRHATALEQEIADRKRAESERAEMLARAQAARAEAEEANRLKDEFLATVSHELRTPLTAILGWLSMLRADRLDKETSTHALETVERNARAQAQLIEDLVDVSRIAGGKLKLEVRTIDLVPVIAAAIDIVRPAADAKGVHIQFANDARVGAVSGDPARLQQVIWNLLSNAVKFTSRDGHVYVSFQQSNSSAELVVRDTGIGIHPGFLPNVFERFRQAEGPVTRTHRGLGLGLAIVRHLIELHGGTVTAESQGEGLGATFTIRMPLAAIRSDDGATSGSDQPAAEKTPPTRQPLEGLRVLVVEDEPDARELLSLTLECSGAEVEAVTSAQEALDNLQVFKPDVLLSDIGLPTESGYDLIRKVRSLSSEASKIPAVALTAFATEKDRELAISAGFQMHLAKPVDPEVLVAAIERVANSNHESQKP